MKQSADIEILIKRSRAIAGYHHHLSTDIAHVLGALFLDSDIVDVFSLVGVDVVELGADLSAHLDTLPQDEDTITIGDPYVTRDVAMLLDDANNLRIAQGLNQDLNSAHVLKAILTRPIDTCFPALLLEKHGITTKSVQDAVANHPSVVSFFDRIGDILNASNGLKQAEPVYSIQTFTPVYAPRLSMSGADKAGTATPKKPVGDDSVPDAKQVAEANETLAKYAVNLNEQALLAKTDPLIGRHDEVEQVIRILKRRRKNNPVLIGEPGVGKTAIAEGLALRIVRKEVPVAVRDFTIYSLDVGSLVAGTKYRGEFEERIAAILKAVEVLEDAVVFIDEIHLLVGSGATSGSSMDAATLLKPALARGKLRCIGATTYDDFMSHMEKDRALVRRFKQVRVDPPSIEDSKTILLGLKEHFDAHYGIDFTAEALAAAVELTDRYLRNATLPDKAIDLIDDIGARQITAETRKQTITVADVEEEIAAISNIPMTTIQDTEGTRLLGLGEAMAARVFGQPQAIEAVVNAIKISRVGLRDPNKPEGAFIFSGPTGVGKTEVAKTLADELSIPLVRFDMSEYMEKHTLSSLIGAPPGYVGHGESGAGSGLLIAAIEKSPRCVLLLDEVEKAHPDIFNILLQVMDAGRLTSSNGKTVDFRNVILIMTTNAGAAQLTTPGIGFGQRGSNDADHKALKKFFAPEFLNRVDTIVRFSPLGLEYVRGVVCKFFGELETMLADREIGLVVEPDALDWFARHGYDPVYGARPLSRLISDRVKLPVANMILSGDVKAGAQVIVSATFDELEITSRNISILQGEAA